MEFKFKTFYVELKLILKVGQLLGAGEFPRIFQ